MSEAVKWFSKAGVTPDVVLRAWFEKVFQSQSAETMPSVLNEALFLYAKIHPDMDVKGISSPKALSQHNVYLGDQQHFQQLQATPAPQEEAVSAPVPVPVLDDDDNDDSQSEEVTCVNEKELSATGS